MDRTSKKEETERTPSSYSFSRRAGPEIPQTGAKVMIKAKPVAVYWDSTSVLSVFFKTQTAKWQ